jgi:hypothetical protein
MLSPDCGWLRYYPDIIPEAFEKPLWIYHRFSLLYFKRRNAPIISTNTTNPGIHSFFKPKVTVISLEVMGFFFGTFLSEVGQCQHEKQAKLYSKLPKPSNQNVLLLSRFSLL